MPEKTLATSRDLIVSLRGLEGIRQVESAQAASPTARAMDPLELTLVMNRYRNALQNLERETAASDPDVLVTVTDRETSLLQSRIASEATAAQPLGPGGLEVKFGTGVQGGDWFGWMKSLFDWVDRTDAHPIIRPTGATVEMLPDRARIAMVGDWGTGLYGAPVSATTIAKSGGFDLLLHLGDVYYSGTEKEIEDRFLAVWPTASGKVSRALNSNHEMYSGGFGYFKKTLGAFKQAASYFAIQNQHWLLIGLDTAYVDHDMDQTQVGWVNQVVKNAGGRKIVLFSHQQLFSRLSGQGPKLYAALKPLLDGKLVTAWYWGHEHQCVLYDRHAGFNLWGRCLGHGGIPEPRNPEVKTAAPERQAHAMSWKRLGATPDSPSCLVLDGRNEYIKGKEEKFAPHGYMTIDLDGPKLTERIFTPDGKEIWSFEIT